MPEELEEKSAAISAAEAAAHSPVVGEKRLRDEDDGELCFSRKSCGQWVDPGWRRYEEDGLDADGEPEPDWAAERLLRTTRNDHEQP